MGSSVRALQQGPEERAQVVRKAAVLGGGVVGGVVVRQLLAKAWKRVDGRAAPPLTPDDPAVTWQRALLWAVSSGVAAGISRLLARRLTASAVNPG